MKWIPLLLPIALAGCACQSAKKSAAVSVDPTQIEVVQPEIPEVEPPRLIEPEKDYPDGVPLRLSFVSGEKYSRVIAGEVQYAVDGGPAGSETKVPIRMTFVAETIAVDGNEATIRVSTSRLEAGDDSRGSARDPDVFEMVVDDRGQLQEAAPGLMSTAVTVAFVPFPVARVKPGTEWGLETNLVDAMFGEVAYLQKYVYRGVKRVGGRQVWQVDTSAVGGDKIDIEGTYYFDAANGQLVEAAFTLIGRGTMPGPDGNPVPATSKFDVKISAQK